MPRSALAGVGRDHIERYILATALTAGDAHVVLHGPPGTGKSTLAMRCGLPNQEIVEITLRGDQGDTALFGMDAPVETENGGMKLEWRDGPALHAAESGALLVMNEIGRAGSDVIDRLYMLLDHHSVAQDTLPNSRVVKINPNFRCIATTNEPPDILPEAVRDRFAIVIAVTEPSTEQLDRLDDDIRDLCKSWYAAAAKTDALSGPECTYRNALNFCNVRRAIGNDEVAAMLVLGSRERAVTFAEDLKAIKVRKANEQKEWVSNMFRSLSYASELMITRQGNKKLFENLDAAAKAATKIELQKLLAV